jgi:putative transcriptional regulator
MNRRSAIRAIGASTASLLLFGARAARADEDLTKPLLLVATPDLDGPYRHTAILAAPLGDKHIGFILNRASDVKLAALFPDSQPAAKIADPVYIGGPEMSGALFALAPRDPGGKSLRLFGDVFVTGAAESLDRLIESPGETRFFAGFVGWMPGELGEELEDGCWFTAEPEPAQLFRRDTATMWEDLVKKAKAIQV